MHTRHSDGTGSHDEIAMAAIRAGIDAVIVTDHNVWVKEKDGYYYNDGKKVLLLVGEEVHDQTRDPQKNHLLIFGVDHEMSSFAKNPQNLIDKVSEFGGLSFIAHPFDPEAADFNEPDLSWVDWDVTGFTGIELWNAMSEFKGLLRNKLMAIKYAYTPKTIGHGPFAEVLKIWDQLTRTGRKVVAIGGSDAHAMHANLGPLKRVLFPYEFHFQAVNTHILTDEKFSGDQGVDRDIVLKALRKGHAFVGYDLPAKTTGFRFYTQGSDKKVLMGDEVSFTPESIFQIQLPQKAECLLLKNGKMEKRWGDCKAASFQISESGVYRVEAYLQYKGKKRGWIFSNPIYVRS